MIAGNSPEYGLRKTVPDKNFMKPSKIKLLDYHPQKADMRTDVLYGLRSKPKWASSMYFYDERGSHLFDQITELPEYYPTRTEIGIMQRHAAEMCQVLGKNVMLVELGSGSAQKVGKLLDQLDEISAYVPIEISREHLINSAERLQEEYPNLEILPVCADFTAEFDLPEPAITPQRVVVYFPGSTIGNFDPPDALTLLKNCARLAGGNGGMLIGVDLRKNPDVITPAYNDNAGVTAAFNMNLLERLNRELGTNFDLEKFHHEAVWNDDESRIEMYLISDTDQQVTMGDEVIAFKQGERINTESSYKFSRERFAALAKEAGFSVNKVWTDECDWFSVQYLETVA